MKWTVGKIKERCRIDGECWLWGMALTTGYPVFTPNGKKTVMVRRWLWEHMHGEIEERTRWCVRSSCGHKTCCNPAHLFLASRASVVASAWTPLARARNAQFSRDRAAVEGGPFAQKFPQSVIDAVRCDPCSAKEAAEKYGMTYSYAHKLRRGKCRRQTAAAGSSIFAMAGAL